MPIRPVITIVNNTHEPLYIYAGESIYGVDPEPDEVDEIMRSKPDIIAPGKEFRLSASFMSLIREDATIDISWQIGGMYEYNSMGGGGQNFILSSTEGFCSVLIKVQPGFHNNTLEDNHSDLCLKNIKPFRYHY